MALVTAPIRKFGIAITRNVVCRPALTASVLEARRYASSSSYASCCAPRSLLFSKPAFNRSFAFCNTAVPSRAIATSEKKKDSISIHHEDVSSKLANAPVDTNYVARKDWFSRGVDQNDEDYDKWGYFYDMIIGVIFLMIFPFWWFTYVPNITAVNRDWLMREAYLELHRREKFGLPLVDPDFIPRENIVLPSEEDLQDFLVVI